MTTQSPVDKLREMRLSAMASAFEGQCGTDADTWNGLSFEDRFGMLVDREWEQRRNNKLSRLIRSAGFRYPGACMEDIEYHADRKLNRGELLRLPDAGTSGKTITSSSWVPPGVARPTWPTPLAWPRAGTT